MNNYVIKNKRAFLYDFCKDSIYNNFVATFKKKSNDALIFRSKIKALELKEDIESKLPGLNLRLVKI